MKLLSFCAVMVITPAFITCWSQTTAEPGGSGVNLDGKMFTLSQYEGGLSLFSPYMSTTTRWPRTATTTPSTTTRGWITAKPTTTTTTKPTTTRQPTTTTKPTTTTTTKPTTTTTTKPTTTTTTKPTTTRWTTTTTKPTTTRWTTTTRPSTRGVSVCLRYMTDTTSVSIFTLSPSSTPMKLEVNGPLSYRLSFSGYDYIYLQSNIRLSSDLKHNMWTSICITVDSIKNVAQMFRNSYMSIRKLLPHNSVWSGEPVIDFSGFQGQVTDVHVWDYPLHYKEVLYYMSAGSYGPYQGSVLNWSFISYSTRGKTLLEENYKYLMQKPTDRETRGHRLKWDKMSRKGFKVQWRKIQLI